ncbi:MAG TPA: hypothetical protein H9900_03445 [Candidatus Monoglobus merdigallinarum]|uniref:GH26 domain-containing protein n=1 Tax=Candidatus Monoglobus merdigallinarum TaxID=2838698 RepID=A0A9D1TLE8_9FIRM|nr:hypothetical protein [Candidatus Monoglobus merdigallinarum]
MNYRHGRFMPIVLVCAAVLIVSILMVVGICRGNDDTGSGFAGSYSVSYMPVYVDGIPIRGYFCDDTVVISLEDLSRYGFEKNYDSEKNIYNLRTMSDITEYPGMQLIPASGYSAVLSDGDYRINGIKIDVYMLDNNACVSVDDLVALTDEYNVWWGWSDYNMNGGYDPGTQAFYINCFRPRVDDWTALLHEMESKVNVTELDIYTEGAPEEAVYYGARLEPRSGVYAGIVSDGNGDPETGREEVFHHDFGVYSSYIEFDDFQTQLFKPSSYIVPEKNCISQVPWNISDINLALDSDNDGYIRETLDNLAEYNKPTIIRFGGEMNIGYLGDSPSAYVKAFRKIADIVHEYPNFAVMWSPNDNGSLDRPFWFYYPGDEYVDWIGVSSFSKKDFHDSLLLEDGSEVNTSREAQIYFTLGEFGYTTNSLKYITEFMAENNINKPLAISEGGVVSNLAYTDENIDRWGEVRIRNMYWYAAMRYPQLKSIVYFNRDMETEIIGFDLKHKPQYCAIMEEAFNSGQYLLSYGSTPEFVFVKADEGRVYGADSMIPIYTYAYLPEQYTQTVEYYIDGSLFAAFTDIPYRTELDASALPHGTHTLTVSVLGEESNASRDYTITKSGGSVTIR